VGGLGVVADSWKFRNVTLFVQRQADQVSRLNVV